jgi:caffeoyl-CoA O-methyltransferase
MGKDGGVDRPKTIGLSHELHRYLLDHGSGPDPLLQDLARVTRELGAPAAMQVPPEQGALLALLVRLTCARTVVEIGTFTGTSSIWMGRALPPGGHLHCFDVSEEWTSVARRYWGEAGLADRITLHLGPALETLDELGDATVGFAFVDADKVSYERYVDALLPRLAPDGLIAVDNVLWSGAVLDPDDRSRDTVAIRAFNDAMAQRADLEVVMLPVGDGLSLISRR